MLGAYGIGNCVSSVVFIMIFGGSSAISTMIGQDLGADQEERASDIARKMFLVSVGFSAIESVIVYFFRVPIFQFFVNDQKVIEMGSTYITYFVPALPFYTAFRLSTSVLEGTGSTKIIRDSLACLIVGTEDTACLHPVLHIQSRNRRNMDRIYYWQCSSCTTFSCLGFKR